MHASVPIITNCAGSSCAFVTTWKCRRKEQRIIAHPHAAAAAAAATPLFSFSHVKYTWYKTSCVKTKSEKKEREKKKTQPIQQKHSYVRNPSWVSFHFVSWVRGKGGWVGGETPTVPGRYCCCAVRKKTKKQPLRDKYYNRDILQHIASYGWWIL